MPVSTHIMYIFCHSDSKVRVSVSIYSGGFPSVFHCGFRFLSWIPGSPGGYLGFSLVILGFLPLFYLSSLLPFLQQLVFVLRCQATCLKLYS